MLFKIRRKKGTYLDHIRTENKPAACHLTVFDDTSTPKVNQDSNILNTTFDVAVRKMTSLFKNTTTYDPIYCLLNEEKEDKRNELTQRWKDNKIQELNFIGIVVSSPHPLHAVTSKTQPRPALSPTRRLPSTHLNSTNPLLPSTGRPPLRRPNQHRRLAAHPPQRRQHPLDRPRLLVLRPNPRSHSRNNSRSTSHPPAPPLLPPARQHMSASPAQRQTHRTQRRGETAQDASLRVADERGVSEFQCVGVGERDVCDDLE